MLSMEINNAQNKYTSKYKLVLSNVTINHIQIKGLCLHNICACTVYIIIMYKYI